MSLTVSIIALVVAVVSAAASLGLWRSQRHANEIQASIAWLEEGRRHDELQPEFGIQIAQRSTALDHADLEIKLLRPPVRLDQVMVTILDESGQDHWARGFPDGLSPEEADLFVWGPWQFNTGASAQVVNTRTTRPREYSQLTGKDADVLDLVHTRPGHWMGSMTQQTWNRDREGPVGFYSSAALRAQRRGHSFGRSKCAESPRWRAQ